MKYAELAHDLSDEDLALRDMVHQFATEVMRPAGIKLDRYGDPADAIAKDNELWPVIRKFRELGLHRAVLPETVGGMAQDLSHAAHYFINEELGYGDSGLAISLEVSSMPFMLASMVPAPKMQELARAYCADTKGDMIGCWAITEPDHGSDWFLGKDNAACSPQVKAVRKGDEYILNGEKAAWVSNGTIATHASLHLGMEEDSTMAGSGIAVIPLDLPGISRGKALDKMGQRPLNQGSIVFEDARIPADYVVMPSGTMPMLAETLLAGVNGGMAVTFAGLARAIFDLSLEYAQERIQGGVPIFEHKNVKANLFRMFRKVECARALAYRTHMYNAHDPTGGAKSAPHSVAGKVTSTQYATEIAADAIMLFGGNGLSKEYPIEKLYRDARTSMVEDGVNEALGIVAIEHMTGTYMPTSES